MWESLKENMNEWIFGILIKAIENVLGMIVGIFEKSITNVQSGVVETPSEFSAPLVETLRIISENAVLPVAGLVLTYIFCYELYQMVTEKNRGGDFETGQLMFLIFKTAGMIMLVTHSFDISLAFFDLGQWMTNQIPASALVLPDAIQANLLDNIEDGDVGGAMMMTLVASIGLVASLIMAGIIYLVAWSRIIIILMYVSIAPLPFATFMNKDWIGSIGQTFVKNLVALMLQGFFIMVCLVIYAGLLEKAAILMATEESGIYGMVLMLVTMAVLVMMLTRTHSLAKSVVGVA